MIFRSALSSSRPVKARSKMAALVSENNDMVFFMVQWVMGKEKNGKFERLHEESLFKLPNGKQTVFSYISSVFQLLFHPRYPPLEA